MKFHECVALIKECPEIAHDCNNPILSDCLKYGIDPGNLRLQRGETLEKCAIRLIAKAKGEIEKKKVSRLAVKVEKGYNIPEKELKTSGKPHKFAKIEHRLEDREKAARIADMNKARKSGEGLKYIPR